MRIWLLFLLAAVAAAQNPITPRYPGAIPTDTDLHVAKNLLGASFTLTAGIDSSTLTLNVNDGSLMLTPGVVRIEFELIKVCSRAGNVLTVCTGGRGYDGSVAAAHNSGSALNNVVVAAHHNQLAAEIKAISTALGVGFSATNIVRTTAPCADGKVPLTAGGVWTCGDGGTGSVPTSRLINTTSPITGGGDMTADRTIACATCIVSTGSYAAPSWLTGLQPTSAKDAANGYAGLTAGTKLTKSQGDEVWGIADLWDASGKRGDEPIVQMTKGSVATDDCAKFDAAGNIVSSGAACSTGVTNPGVSFTAQTSVTFTHNLNTLNVLIQCYDGSDNAIAYNGLTLTSVNAASITFAAAQTGRCAANGTGGGSGGGGGGTVDGANIGSGTFYWFKEKAGEYLRFHSFDVTTPIVAALAADKITFSCPTCLVSTGSYSAPSWLNKRGNGANVQMTTGSVATNDCAKFDADGNIVSAGAACSSSAANPSTSFTGQTSVSWTHNLNTLNVLIQCYDASDNLIAQNGHQLTSVNAATVTFSAAQTGRCVANGNGGSGGGGSDPNAVTAPGTLTSNAPVIGAGSKAVAVGTRSGNTTEFATVTGSKTTNKQLAFDASGNVIASATDIGGSGGSPGGSAGQIQYNNAGAFGGLILGAGLEIVSGELKPTSAVASQLSATAALDFGSIAASACAELTFTLTGAIAGDTVQPGWPSTLEAGLLGNMFVSATNTVKARLCKITTGSVDPASANFSATIVRSF
jgi:hypothetical protein